MEELGSSKNWALISYCLTASLIDLLQDKGLLTGSDVIELRDNAMKTLESSPDPGMLDAADLFRSLLGL